MPSHTSKNTFNQRCFFCSNFLTFKEAHGIYDFKDSTYIFEQDGTWTTNEGYIRVTDTANCTYPQIMSTPTKWDFEV